MLVLGYLTSTGFFSKVKFTEEGGKSKPGDIDLEFHLYVMMGLAVCLMLLVNYFVMELKNVKQQQGSVGETTDGNSKKEVKCD